MHPTKDTETSIITNRKALFMLRIYVYQL